MNHDDFLVPPDQPVRLAAHDPNGLRSFATDADAAASTTTQVERLRRAQDLLRAHATYGVLILFQGMDAAGKDETIQAVLSALDPLGTQATPFKAPTATEAQHDYLWRAVQALPRRGQVAIFSRSYYEQVTTEQVYPDQIAQWGLPEEALENLWDTRYAQINNFERHLVENGFLVLKFFLHVSQETERARLLERIADPALQWQFSEADLRHHQDWDAFQQSYEAMLDRTSTAWAPWYLIPANQREQTYAAVAAILVDHFTALHADYPVLDDAERHTLEHARAALHAANQQA